MCGYRNATDNNNAGELPGILTIQNPQSYTQVTGGYRAIEATLAGHPCGRLQGVLGSGWGDQPVIDVTHNVVVPFMADSLGAGWGVPNQAAAAAVSTAADARPSSRCSTSAASSR